MRRMERVTGRTDDMIVLRGVNVFPTQIEEIVLRVPGLAPHYQCVVSRPGRLDELTVRVEARAGAGDHAALGRRLEAMVKHGVGVTVTAEVLPPAALERSVGKATRLVDLRP
jgi:phenylacetate-CoA ligase